MKIIFNVKGTEKQVKWCKDILKDFNDFFTNIDKVKEYSEDIKYLEGYKYAESIINEINSENASYIIDRQNKFLKPDYEPVNLNLYLAKKWLRVILDYKSEAAENQNFLRFMRLTENLYRKES